jgi:lipopolysaccharide export system protein LptC
LPKALRGSRLTTTYPTDKPSRSFAVTDRPSSDVLYRRARRHSRRVRTMRILIPILIAVGLFVSGLLVWLNPLRLLSELPASFGRLSVSGTRMTMTEPRLAGYTRDGRRYELTANAAAQDIARADVVNLEQPRASLEMSENNKLEMQAAEGVFDRKAGVLTLRRNILLTSTEGHEARLSEAVIDMRDGSVISDKPVEVKSLQGTLRSNRLQVLKSGEIVRFDGGVVMVILPAESEPADKQTVPQ